MSLTFVAPLIALVAAALAAASYFVAGRPERALWPAVAGRAVAWVAVALLLANVSCPTTAGTEVPIVLLDVSPSLDAAGGQADQARALASELGEVRTFSGSRLLQPLTTAVASGRQVVVISDGELPDAAGLSPSLISGTTVQILPRRPVADLALVGVEGPRHVSQGDSLRLVADLRVIGAADAGGLAVEVLAGTEILARTVVADISGGRARVVLELGRLALPPGDHLVEVRLTGTTDAEPRTDRRLVLLTVAATPGIIVVAKPGSWDSRFFYRSLVAVAGLPVRGFIQLEPSVWLGMNDLRPVAAATVRRAVQNADLLVSFGAEPEGSAASRARGHWRWPAEAATDGDWYLEAETGSPISGAFAGISTDSLLPANGLIPIDPPRGSWTGLSARLGRRGTSRPALIGTESGEGRRLVVAVTGLWRWAFQGGLSEQAYRSWVSSSVTWLLGSPRNPADGEALPMRPVVERDEPLVFQWRGEGPPVALPMTLEAASTTRQDTLAFDGSGRAFLNLDPGTWRYTLQAGGTGLLAVEEYSSEFLPAPVTLEAQEAERSPARRNRGSRDLPWLFALAVTGWCVEWTARRRAGRR